MSSHVYHEIYLHLNWHVKDDMPLLTGSLEELTYGFLREKCRMLKGVHLHDNGGTVTHVHVAVNIEPVVTISDMLQELKGFSSFEVNRRTARKALEWQRGYGVVSFGKAHLDWVLDYIRNQRRHHATGKVEERLEKCDVPDDEDKPG